MLRQTKKGRFVVKVGFILRCGSQSLNFEIAGINEALSLRRNP